MSADSPDLNAFAAQLAGLQPATGLSRDRTLFEAGRRSARPKVHWPVATLLLAGLSLWLAVKPASRNESVQIAENPVVTQDQNASVSHTGINYFQLRQIVVHGGVDALPQLNLETQPHTPMSIANSRLAIN